MAKKSTPDPKTRTTFPDPVTDSMRIMGRAFAKLNDLDAEDKKIVLGWINKRFIKGNKDLTVTS